MTVLTNTGAPIDTSAILSLPCSLALLHIGQLGNTGSRAVLRIMEGTAVPSGKLADTWACAYEDYPEAKEYGEGAGMPDDVLYREGLFIGYRWFDSYGIRSNFSFGFGLSYTVFSIRELEEGIPCKVDIRNAKVTVSCTVRNTGGLYAGKEVVQLYAGHPDSCLPAPRKELCAFTKTRVLLPGQEHAVSLTFTLSDLAVYDECRAAWILQKGDYPLYLGTQIDKTICIAVIRVENAILTQQCRNLFVDPDPVEELKPPVFDAKVPKDVPVYTWDGTGINASYPVYAEKVTIPKAGRLEHEITWEDVKSGLYTLEELVSQLTAEELAWMCIGSIEADVKDIIGSSSGLVPGAAGDTCRILYEKRHVPGLIMADGPAGLRLVPEFSDGGETFYQYCTAMPVAASLAQTWDPSLAEKAGDIVAEEMTSFGVKLWLAPALNLHRNPLCGRNFEYFSEDPLLSSAFAGAWVRSVERHPGKGVVIKHFACNNQENNRLYVNEHISERALRELYLKGFQKVVEETSPAAVMAAYNLINGRHCASNEDLLVHVLRREWGYEGMVMTDWFSTQDIKGLMGIGETKYSHTDPAECIRAGVSLQMPGNRALVEELLECVNTGTITCRDLQVCVLYLFKAILSLDGADA